MSKTQAELRAVATDEALCAIKEYEYLNLAERYDPEYGDEGALTEDEMREVYSMIVNTNVAPGPQIIRTAEELEALDPDTWLMQADEETIPMVVGDWIHDYHLDGEGIFPLVVMMVGSQVRAARKALEEE